MPTQIWTQLDYQRSGKQIGHLHLPHSVHRSAYGTIPIPIGVVAGGKGPTMLLTAGTHGDEYEGQIALTKLLRTIDPASINGRLIVLPMLNSPAALAGCRVSPLDGGNLNRAYPGDPLGGPTEAIADYVSTVLLPLADFYQDFHAGGSSLIYLPFVSIRRSGNPELDDRALAAARAFGAPYLQIWGYSPDPRLSTAESNRQGIVSLGGGTVSRQGLALIENGIRRLLVHFGMVEATQDKPVPRAIEVEVLGRDYYVYATENGVFEPMTDMGDHIEAGALCGMIHVADDPTRSATPQHFDISGIVVCQRHPSLVVRGDCLAHLATPRI